MPAAEKKPVIASMADVAASGGYYIAMAAQKIVAERLTITGSIGVVTGKVSTMFSTRGSSPLPGQLVGFSSIPNGSKTRSIALLAPMAVLTGCAHGVAVPCHAVQPGRALQQGRTEFREGPELHTRLAVHV
jgi:hypothetical protein